MGLKKGFHNDLCAFSLQIYVNSFEYDTYMWQKIKNLCGFFLKGIGGSGLEMCRSNM
jgi:hypothetical protein